MKKILLTLIISIVVLGFASFLFSLSQNPEQNSSNLEQSPSNVESGANQEKPFKQARLDLARQAHLPSAQDTLLTASLNPNFMPVRDWTIKEPEIEAKAAAVFDPNGEKFLYQKNVKEKLPIASLTKIMTATVTLENLALDNIITISKKAVMTEGENGQLVIGEELSIRDLLYIMLIESSNDAAVALAAAFDVQHSTSETHFVALMNKKIKEIGLENTHFVDSTGISKWNYSTAMDLAQLTKYSFNSKSLIWQILGIKEIEIHSQNKETTHQLINTNKLLDKVPQMIGGKTGFTEEAGGCMLTMIKIPDKPGEYLITIILGSENRELETKKLIEWINKAYLW